MEKRRFGMTLDEWDASKRRLESMLLDAASRRGTITYGEAARDAFGGRFSARSMALVALLDEVDTMMLDRFGVMPAALVVRADTGRPGLGYFAFAERAEGRTIADREEYWQAQARSVWDAFSRPDLS